MKLKLLFGILFLLSVTVVCGGSSGQSSPEVASVAQATPTGTLSVASTEVVPDLGDTDATAIAAAVAATVAAVAEADQEPTPTNTLSPASTATQAPTPTNTLSPASTATQAPTPTNTLSPASTATPMPPSLKPSLEWIPIPLGNFTMGSSETDIQAAVADCNAYEGNCQVDWFASETPQRTESTGAFEITKYEITNAQYDLCVTNGPCRPPREFSSDGSVTYKSIYFNGYYPVVTITKEDANIFCNWVGGRLPSEKEWEKAARGADGRRYPWGNNLDMSRANLYSGSPKPVGSYPSGANGLMDMAGNVAEFTGDNVVRGGSWKSFPHHGRTTQRSTGPWLTSDFVNFDIGFRCIK